MNHSILWHDYETFGANPRLDRPCQFAGLRTDLELNFQGDPVELYCQPPVDVLPHPQACLITGITPDIALERGRPEPEFIRQVLDELGQPGTCGAGYNSLRFDDELTRHTAWRNFYDPYAREWRNGCSRWDIIDMARLTYALRPEGIHWPRRADGKPSFRLEDLAQANALEQAQAHDALSDVRATIALARLIRRRQPRLYEFVFNSRGKAAARKLLDLQSRAAVVHVSQRFPAELGCLSVVMPLVAHPTNGNAVLVFDLRVNPADLLELDPVDIHERLYTPTADLPEGVARIPVKAVHVNKCPVLAPLATLQPAQAERLALNLELVEQHRASLQAHIGEVAAKLTEVFAMGEFPPVSDPEQDLYGGFIGDADRRICEHVTQLPPAAVADFQPAFQDRRLGEIWFRYRARHFPDGLNEAEREDWRRFRERRLEYAPDGGLTLDEYNTLLAELMLRFADDPGKTEILRKLLDWAKQIRP